MSTTRAATALLLVGALLGAGSLAGTEPGGVDRCLELVERKPQDLESYRCFWSLARRTGAWDESKAALEKLLADRPDDPRVLLYLGAIENDRRDARAPQLFARAAAGFEAAHDAAGEVYARISLGLWLNGQKRTADARPHLERALAVAESARDPQLVARARVALGWNEVAREDFARARSLFLEAEAVVFPNGPYDVKNGVLDGLGYVEWATGRTRAALLHYRRQAELNAAAGNAGEEVSCRYNIALMANALAETPEDVSSADTLTVQALEATVRVGNPDVETRLRLLLAQPFDGDPARRAEAERALRLARAAAVQELVLQAMRGLGQHDFAAGRRAAGLAEVERAVASAQQMGSRIEVVSGLLDLAELLWEDGKSRRATQVSRAALDAIESLRDLQSSDEERARVASSWAEGYTRLVGRLLGGQPSVDDLEQALQVSERLRLQMLLELLEKTGAGTVRQGELDRAQTLTLRSLQADLGPREALVSYQVANRFNSINRWQGGSWAVVITTNGARAVPLADTRELDAAVTLYLGLVQRRDGAERRAAARLYELVVGPVLRGLPEGVREVVLVPDGSLNTVPFAALRPAPDAPPLGVGLVVSSAPSLTLWSYWRHHPVAARAGGALALADPDLGPGRAGLSPLLQHVASGLGRLPYARREARRVCQRLGGGSRLLQGAAASEGVLRTADLRSVAVLHLAAHTLVDGEEPARSAILLAASGADEDGWVSVAEVSALALNDALVVLASCRSASGVVLQGEGVLGLTRAFFRAGARSVVGTLWPVDDRDTARLMDSFYRHLAGGAGVAHALAAAQREAIAAGEPTVAWAGLVAVGDGTLTVAADRTGAGPWTASGVVAAVLVLAAVLVGGGTWCARKRLCRFRAS